MRKTHVLFLDQNQTRFNDLKVGLNEEDYLLKLVTHIEEGINLLTTQNHWHILVIDASFLNQDRVLSWVKTCKENYSFLKVILLGNEGSKSEVLKALRLGASEYLEAPVSVNEFHRTLTQALGDLSPERKHHPATTSQEYEKPQLRLLTSVSSMGTGSVPNMGTGFSVARDELTQSVTETVTLSFTAMKRRWAESFEREYLTELLAKMQGNVSAAAREAKLDRSNFLRLLRKHGLKAEVYRRSQSSIAA